MHAAVQNPNSVLTLQGVTTRAVTNQLTAAKPVLNYAGNCAQDAALCAVNVEVRTGPSSVIVPMLLV